MISRGTAVTLAALSLALATGQSACTDNKSAETNAPMTPEQKRAADSVAEFMKMSAPLLNAHDLSSLAKLPAPPAELQEDTIPIRTPDDQPARLGIRSGMLLQKFRGGMTGERRTTWAAYGMKERKEENYHPLTPIKTVPVEQQNINKIVIATPDHFFILDPAKKTGNRMNNMEDETYLMNDSLKTMSFEEFVSTRLTSREPRLADTTINGYKLRVYQVNTPTFSLTRWVWRGLTMLEHWRGLTGPPDGPTPPDTLEFYAEPAEISFNVDPPESLFAPGAEYKLDEGAPVTPGQRMDPPPQNGQRGPGGPPGPPGAPGAPGTPPQNPAPPTPGAPPRR